jgi:hypothetical protein
MVALHYGHASLLVLISALCPNNSNIVLYALITDAMLRQITIQAITAERLEPIAIRHEG